ncbi:MAG: 3,4-dihydroxy 2-butanone 4-phosphate synthase [Geoglossum simile]|nr:MAG: 3,4-dihydroxy 2-butanone 4-phosphate synthase [Geoglossum simile]
MNGTMDSAVVNGVKKAAILAEEEEVPELDTIEDTIEAFKRGEFIVVLDSTSRENEGDLIIAAEDVTTEKMAFMIRHTSGLICAPLPPSLTHSLSLPQMTNANTDRHQTAYTISVDASQPTITTGISAHDRALTCRTLASPTATPQSFRRPGHLFPLRAREGGVKERRGHTEAAVEFCRLAGKREVGVISELVDDGAEVEGKAEVRGSGMLRRDGCLRFGRRWGLRVCTIERLCEFLEREGR